MRKRSCTLVPSRNKTEVPRYFNWPTELRKSVSCNWLFICTLNELTRRTWCHLMWESSLLLEGSDYFTVGWSVRVRFASFQILYISMKFSEQRDSVDLMILLGPMDKKPTEILPETYFHCFSGCRNERCIDNAVRQGLLQWPISSSHRKTVSNLPPCEVLGSMAANPKQKGCTHLCFWVTRTTYPADNQSRWDKISVEHQMLGSRRPFSFSRE